MEMRACEDIEAIGEDLTPQIAPLSFSLYDPFLLSHCSSCFLPLPNLSPFLPNNPINPHPIPIHYCSTTCSTSDSHRHLSSGESQLFHILQSQPTTWTGDTSDLRSALRLLLHFQDLGLLHLHPTHHYNRIYGLMSNHEKLVSEGEDEILERIKEGGRLMGMARRMRNGDLGDGDENLVEEILLCQVLTNAVEVQVNEQGSLGIAIYGPGFSWINHSCSPNACYRFLGSWSEREINYDASKLRVFASSGEGNVLKTCVCDEKKLNNGNCGYGPRIIVRSIKPIKKGEEICISYTDLLQPKATRRSELWTKYRFSCCCLRCSASPPTYVDRVLRESAVAQIEESNSCSDNSFNENEEYEELTECMDDIISEYMSDGNPESCCEKLESMLTLNLHDEKPEALLLPNFKLHPLHHLSINAYTILASAYKIRANNLSALFSGIDDRISEVFELSKTSTAYYFLLAGVTQHLFLSESSLIAIAAHFWISAGESLLNFVKNQMWNSSLNPQPSYLVLSSPPDNGWKKCMLMEKLEMNLVSSQSQSKLRQREFEEISKSFLGCLSKILPRVWTFLIHGHHYLKYIKNPTDFSWLEITKNHNPEESQSLLGSSTGVGSSYFGRRSCYCRCEAGEGIDKQKTRIVLLGIHCLVYGGYLANICYSSDCYLTAYVRNLLSQLDKQGSK